MRALHTKKPFMALSKTAINHLTEVITIDEFGGMTTEEFSELNIITDSFFTAEETSENLEKVLKQINSL